MGLSSINTGLQQTPDLTDIMSAGKLGFQFISIYNAINVLAQAIDTYTGNTPPDAQGNNQNQPPDQTVTLGNFSSFWATAAVSISSGFLVAINSAGQIVLASPNGSQVTTGTNQSPNTPGAPTNAACGIAVSSASAGAQIHVMLRGLVNFGTGNLKPGAIYYPGSSPGSLTYNPGGMTAGWGKQVIGVALNSALMFVAPSLTVASY